MQSAVIMPMPIFDPLGVWEQTRHQELTTPPQSLNVSHCLPPTPITTPSPGPPVQLQVSPFGKPLSNCHHTGICVAL